MRVLAWTRPIGLPSGAKRLTTPVGLMGWTEGSFDASADVRETTCVHVSEECQTCWKGEGHTFTAHAGRPA